MSKKRANWYKRFNVTALIAIAAGIMLIVAAGAIAATVIVRSEDHPRMTTIDPHTALTPVMPTHAIATTIPSYVSTTTQPPMPEDPVLSTEEVTPWSPPEMTTTTTTTTTTRAPWTPSIISPPHVPTMHCYSFKPRICVWY